ncbi:hypothetical protein ABKN59_010121 [Abortiporus biennis]
MLERQETLLPGYNQVHRFSNDDNYERNEDGDIEEEVVYVTLDLGQVEPTLVPSTSSYRLIGLDTPTPYLQLSGTVFKGQHQHILGTELLFTDSKEDHQDRSKSSSITHISTTEQRIRFKEVEVKPKKSVSEDQTETQTTSTSTKKNLPQTMTHIVGVSDSKPDAPSTPSTRSRRGKGKSVHGKTPTTTGRKGKGKMKEVEPVPANADDDMPVDVVPAPTTQQSEPVAMDVDSTQGG